MPETANGTVDNELAEELPNCLNVLSPQHFNDAEDDNAQENSIPPEREATPELIPLGTTGTLEPVVLLLPSWPLLLRPQQYAEPEESVAQL